MKELDDICCQSTGLTLDELGEKLTKDTLDSLTKISADNVNVEFKDNHMEKKNRQITIPSENLSPSTKLPIWKNHEFINANEILNKEVMLDYIANDAVKELNAHYARLDFEVKQRLKEKGLTPNDVTLVWYPRFDETFVTIRYKDNKYQDEIIKF